MGRLLTDAEAGEDPTQQVIGAECAGDFTQGLLSLAQIFGEQLAGTRQGQLSAAVLKGGAGMTQRLKVTPAGAEAAFRGLFVTHAGLEMVA